MINESIPKVSVLVPIYKVPEKYLKKCLWSLTNQTLNEIEIILVDDGSPDECPIICDEYAKQDLRIKVIHQENKGVSAARNTAFDNASGEYIMFLDGDDYLELNTCEVAYNTAKEKNVQLVFWNEFIDYAHTTKIQKIFGDDELEFKPEECAQLCERVLDFDGKIEHVCSKLMKRSFLEEYSIRHVDELRQGAEDYIFNIQMFEHLQSAYYLPQPFLHYVYNQDSFSNSYNEKNHYMVLHSFEHIEKYIQNSNNREKLQEKLYIRMLHVIITTAITGYFGATNPAPYREKVKGFKQFLKADILQRALKKASRKGLSFKRKITLKLIELKQYRIVALLGKIRAKKLRNK